MQEIGYESQPISKPLTDNFPFRMVYGMSGIAYASLILLICRNMPAEVDLIDAGKSATAALQPFTEQVLRFKLHWMVVVLTCLPAGGAGACAIWLLRHAYQDRRNPTGLSSWPKRYWLVKCTLMAWLIASGWLQTKIYGSLESDLALVIDTPFMNLGPPDGGQVEFAIILIGLPFGILPMISTIAIDLAKSHRLPQ